MNSCTEVHSYSFNNSLWRFKELNNSHASNDKCLLTLIKAHLKFSSYSAHIHNTDSRFYLNIFYCVVHSFCAVDSCFILQSNHLLQTFSRAHGPGRIITTSNYRVGGANSGDTDEVSQSQGFRWVTAQWQGVTGETVPSGRMNQWRVCVCLHLEGQLLTTCGEIKLHKLDYKLPSRRLKQDWIALPTIYFLLYCLPLSNLYAFSVFVFTMCNNRIYYNTFLPKQPLMFAHVNIPTVLFIYVILLLFELDTVSILQDFR